MSISQEQRVFIFEHYFASRSYARVADEFRWMYLDSAVPNNSTTTRLIDRFRESGSVADRKRSGRPTILTEAKLADVEGMMQHSPSKNLRILSAQREISYGSAQKATRKFLREFFGKGLISKGL
jgi:transposase